MNGQFPFSIDLTSLLDAAPSAVVIINEVGKIVQINTQTETIFGYSRNELIGEVIEKLIPNRYHTKHVAHRNNYVKAPCVISMDESSELFGQRKNGLEFPIEIDLRPLQAEEGLFTLAAIRDVTERKRFEQVLREKNLELEKASIAKDNFLASMSHELRTPLNAILGFTGTLLMKLPGDLNPDQEKQLNTIRSSAKHLLSLINDLLDFAKIESGKGEINFEEVNFQSVIDEIFNTLRPQAQNKGLKFTVNTPAKALTMQTDRRALSQIIINLINNAIKFTHKGSIHLELCEHFTPDGDCVSLCIVDTGIGIKAEDQSKLFYAFEQIRNSSTQQVEGTGLGLHLSQKLAAILGGKITCKSEFGKGSSFTLVISRKQEHK